MKVSCTKIGAETRYQECLSNDVLGMGALKASLSKALRSIDTVGWSKREESGRLDRRSLHRYATGERSLFSRRTVAEADHAAVSILLDCSGSMDDHYRIQIAQEVVIQLSKILSQSRSEFCVYGFLGGGTYETVNGAEFLKDIVEIIPFKHWGDSLQKSKLKLGTIHTCALGGTPDYGGIHYAIEDISRRPEQKKIVFVLTDADGFLPVRVKNLENTAKKLGVTIVALGIQSPDCENLFEHGVSINNVNDMCGTALRSLLNQMG